MVIYMTANSKASSELINNLSIIFIDVPDSNW